MSWKTIALVILGFIVAIAILVGLALLIPTNMM